MWDKKITGNPFLAKYQPLKITENIMIFNEKKTYYPIMEKGLMRFKGGGKTKLFNREHKKAEKSDLYYPKNLVTFSNAKRGVHPTQKPILLMEYLIKTYTNENETVLDFTMGSGSTLLACKNLNRNGIGIELDENYFNIAKERCNEKK